MLARAHNRYREIDNVGSVTGRSPIELILLVYDRTADKLRAAEAAIDSNRADLLGTALGDAIDLISQGLMAALDYERGGEIAVNLGSIYDYSVRRLLYANLQRDANVVREIANLLAGLREAWVSVQQSQA
jgi:flagellar protein FliS